MIGGGAAGNFAFAWLTTDGPIHINRAVVIFLRDHSALSSVLCVGLVALGLISRHKRGNDSLPTVNPSSVTTIETKGQSVGINNNFGTVMYAAHQTLTQASSDLVEVVPQVAGRAQLTLIRDRFYALFHAHQIPLTVVPFILRNFGITLSVLNNEDRLLEHIDEKLVDFLARTFNVSAD